MLAMQDNLFYSLIEWIIGLTICAFAAERVTEIIRDSKLFAPFRNFLALLALTTWPSNKKYQVLRRILSYPTGFLNAIVSCSWCLSVWVCLFFVWFVPGGYFSVNVFDNVLVKWFALCRLANFFHDLFNIVYRGRVRSIELSIKISEESPSWDLEEHVSLPDGSDEEHHSEL